MQYTTGLLGILWMEVGGTSRRALTSNPISFRSCRLKFLLAGNQIVGVANMSEGSEHLTQSENGSPLVFADSPATARGKSPVAIASPIGVWSSDEVAKKASAM